MIRFISPLPGQPLPFQDLWTAWNSATALLMPLCLLAVVYAWGVWSIWRRAGAGHGISRRSCARFLGANLALVAALVSPLDALSGALFAAHMAQHLILILIAAPLMVTSDIPLAVLWALPRPWARSLGRLLYHSRRLSRAWRAASATLSAWLWFTLTLWVWHAPVLFEAALRHEIIHAVEHLMFLLSAMLFWRVLFRLARPGAIHSGAAIPYLFTTTLQSSILGALMTFSAQPWYADYAARTSSWGLTPLQDQQLAGLVMWLPGGAVFTLLTIGYFAAWFRSLEQRSVRLQ